MDYKFSIHFRLPGLYVIHTAGFCVAYLYFIFKHGHTNIIIF